MNSIKIIVLLTTILSVAITGCKKDKDIDWEKSKPTIENIEIGLNNNEIGIIAQDFHFNADITASEKIDSIKVEIKQRSGEQYAKYWSHTILWLQYKGTKNTNVHKHFTIPEDAAEGKYDFIITITDENGSRLEETRSIILYTAANVPVNPQATIFNLHRNGSRFYRNGRFSTSDSVINKGDILGSQVTINDVKGNGKMYLLLINKKYNHRPETITQIDFTKAIVYDVYEHKDSTNSFAFTNTPFNSTTNTIIRSWPDLTIGSSIDNNVPANPISDTKAWENGSYYYGVVYLNTTYKIAYYKYIEVIININ